MAQQQAGALIQSPYRLLPSRRTYRARMNDDLIQPDMPAPDMPVDETRSCAVPGCRERALFGFVPSKTDMPRWWCWEHYPYRPDRQSSDPAV